MRRFLSLLVNGWLFMETGYIAVQSLFMFDGERMPVRLSASRMHTLRYFTFQSNVLMALAALVYGLAVLLMLCGVIQRVPAAVRVLKCAATAAIGLTFLVVLVWLGPRRGYEHCYDGASLWTHLLNPLLAMLDWCLLDREGRLPFPAVFAGLAPVVVYGIGYIGNIVRHGAAGNDFYGFVIGGPGVTAAAFGIVLLGAWLIALLLWLPRRKRTVKRGSFPMSDRPKLIVVCGTNASGKSGLGVDLAAKYGGEIVSADSRQVFRGLDLGSGKIAPEEMKGVPHHLIDVCAPGAFFSMHDFQRLAYAAIDGILARGRLPFMVGGTGLYVASVTEGYVMSDRAPDLAYREYLETFETPKLYEMLLAAVPDIQIEKNNRNRVMRVLEKLHDGDDAAPRSEPRYDCLKLGVTWDRETLRARIDERLERRLKQGMIEEVQGLIDAGVSLEFLMKLGLEYRFITQYLTGEIPLKEDMIQQLGTAIKQFAKRQMTWFRRDRSILWLDMTADPFARACAAIDGFLEAE